MGLNQYPIVRSKCVTISALVWPLMYMDHTKCGMENVTKYNTLQRDLWVQLCFCYRLFAMWRTKHGSDLWSKILDVLSITYVPPSVKYWFCDYSRMFLCTNFIMKLYYLISTVFW